MRPGDTKTYTAKDKDTGAITKTIVLHRTTRDYVYDLCDAYNEVLSPGDAERGCRWEVAPNGELKFGFPRHVTDKLTRDRAEAAERERQQYNHRQRHPMQEAAE